MAKAFALTVSVLCALVSTSASSAEIVRAGPGCADKKFTETLFTLRDVNHDIAGFGAMVDAGLADKTCRLFRIGKRVTIEESSVFGLSCVRAEEDPHCFWVLPSMAE